MQLAGRVVLMTGATGGVGQATARELARAGAVLVLAGRDKTVLDDLAAAVRGYAVPGELAEPTAVERLVAAAERLAGPVDVLINNAGVGYAGQLAETPMEQINALVHINLSVPIQLTRLVLPGMLRRGRGRIVLVGSIAGVVGVRNESVYAAAKGGLAVLADSLADELAGTGVGVTLITPAAIATGFFRKRGLEYDRRVPKLMPPERLAATIRAAVEADRRRVMVPRWLELPARLHGSMPKLYRALSARWG